MKRDAKKSRILREQAETLQEMAAELNRLKIDPNTYLQMKLMETASIMRARAQMYETPPDPPTPDATGATQMELPF